MRYDDLSHNELGDILKERGLAIPRKKDERIASLIWNDKTNTGPTTDESTTMDAMATASNPFQERFPWATVPVSWLL